MPGLWADDVVAGLWADDVVAGLWAMTQWRACGR